MNQVILIGRLCAEPSLSYTPNNKPVCKFTLAVDRKFKSDRQPTADFISIVAWNKTAEFISKYFSKGSRLALTGSIQTSTWDAEDGSKRYKTEVLVDNVEFVESKKEKSGYPAVADPDTGRQSNAETFFVLSDDDEDCPF